MGKFLKKLTSVSLLALFVLSIISPLGISAESNWASAYAGESGCYLTADLSGVLYAGVLVPQISGATKTSYTKSYTKLMCNGYLRNAETISCSNSNTVYGINLYTLLLTRITEGSGNGWASLQSFSYKWTNYTRSTCALTVSYTAAPLVTNATQSNQSYAIYKFRWVGANSYVTSWARI
jgi:hypothetical protein